MKHLVDLATFKARHLAALEQDQARHNLMLGLLSLAEKDPARVRLWSVGEGASCALQTDERNLVLGDLSADGCERLAADVKDHTFPGCVGADGVPVTFVNALHAHGLRFSLAMPQRILSLTSAPTFPGVAGFGRLARPDEVELYADWLIGFCIDGKVPEGPPERGEVIARGLDRPIFFWEVNGKPVAMAARTRDTRDGTNISFVYTPRELRGRGYAGSVTAHVCQDIFASGKKLAFLYTDARNPFSNRAYEKIGFRFHCEASHWRRH